MAVWSVASKRSGRRAGSCKLAAVAGLALGLGLGLAGSGAAMEPGPASAGSRASSEVGQLKAWVLQTADNQGLPFLVVDKKGAQVLAFNAEGHPLGASPILLGLARGDASPPGIGDLPLSAITPDQRITPAGRFVASIGRNLGAKSILWIDYESALSLHPVVTAIAADRRLERLASATVDDNRISYGCINVPSEFYEGVIQLAFLNTVGVVYILPETLTLAEIFFDPAGEIVPSLF